MQRMYTYPKEEFNNPPRPVSLLDQSTSTYTSQEMKCEDPLLGLLPGPDGPPDRLHRPGGTGVAGHCGLRPGGERGSGCLPGDRGAGGHTPARRGRR